MEDTTHGLSSLALMSVTTIARHKVLHSFYLRFEMVIKLPLLWHTYTVSFTLVPSYRPYDDAFAAINCQSTPFGFKTIRHEHALSTHSHHQIRFCTLLHRTSPI